MVYDGRRKEDEVNFRRAELRGSDGRRPRLLPPRFKTARQRNRHSSIQLWLWQVTVTTHGPYNSSITRLDIDIICRLGQNRLTDYIRRACFRLFVLVLGMLCR